MLTFEVGNILVLVTTAAIVIPSIMAVAVGGVAPVGDALIWRETIIVAAGGSVASVALPAADGWIWRQASRPTARKHGRWTAGRVRAGGGSWRSRGRHGTIIKRRRWGHRRLLMLMLMMLRVVLSFLLLRRMMAVFPRSSAFPATTTL